MRQGEATALVCNDADLAPTKTCSGCFIGNGERDHEQFWVAAPLVESRHFGHLGGGFSYTTTAGRLVPMFENEDSTVWTCFSERCYNGDPLAVIVRGTRGGQTGLLDQKQVSLEPYSGRSD